MGFYLVLLLLCWQSIGGKCVENTSVESLFDRVSVPTKFLDDFFQTHEKTSSNKSISEKFLESSTIHYQNSNGFIPLISRPYAFKEDNKNFTTKSDDKIREEKVGQQELVDKKLTFFNGDETNTNDNRRSYHTNENQDDFEPLKVNNGTPIIANYDTFYDQSKESSKPDTTYYDDSIRKPLKSREKGRGKKTYLGNYDSRNEDDQYSYSDVTVEQKKNTFQYERSNNGYKQTNIENYSPKSLLPQTNYASMSTPKLKPRQTLETVDNEKKFKSPIITEPSEYKVNDKFIGQPYKSVVSTFSPQSDKKYEIYPLNSEYGTLDNLTPTEGNNRNYDSADSRDFSDEYDDYMGEKERSQRVKKNKRRPHHFDSSRKLPKEHRESYDNSYDDTGYKHTSSRSKSRYQPKSKPVKVVTEYNYNSDTDDSEEQSSHSNSQHNEGFWNQITPNVEVSHSNGYEINQIEKPKLHIVPVNIVPTFDHATALDNSQGFDITNAMFTGFVDGSVVSTAAPLVSSTPSYISENLVSSSTIKPKLKVSTAVPDVIVGQSSFNNPMHAILMPNKLQQNMLHQYVQSTMSPAVFAVTPQSSFSASPTITPQLQQMLNQMQFFPYNQHYMTAQTSNQFNSNNQNSNYKDTPEQNVYQPTSRSTTEATNVYNNKKTKGSGGQYLASASMSVDQGTQRHSHNRHNKKKNNLNNDSSNYNTENNKQLKQNSNTFLQPTVVPAILHTGIGLINNQNQPFLQNPLIVANPHQTSQLFKATNDAIENSIKQLQYNLLANRNQLNAYSNLDSSGGASNIVNSISNIANLGQKAQLPLLSSKNVEIINPNLNSNAYAINPIPAAIVTTPIPIFTTTGFLSTKPAFSTTSPESSGPDRPFFNPINFVPNYDLVKSQSILNNNIVPNDVLSQNNLNLVSLLPGGNFYKHSQGAQVNLAHKPKLSSDLEKYAEEMFKESLKTIYNSHKWNNDPRSPSTNISHIDESDIAKLRSELHRIKSSLRESKKPKDVLEAHQTENKVRTIKPGHNHRRPDSSGEHSHKHKQHSHGSHHHHHPHHHHHKSKPQINSFLTPPRVNSFISKSPFHDKPPKKRPSHGPRPNFNHEKSRPRPRQGVVLAKSKGLDVQESSLVDFRYPAELFLDKYQYNKPDFQTLQNHNYPTFTTPFSEIDQVRASEELKSFGKNLYDVNHQRTHNLMGLLMKNTQLPSGIRSKQSEDRDAVNQMFGEENRRVQSHANGDVTQNFQKKSDRQAQSIPLSRVIDKGGTATHLEKLSFYCLVTELQIIFEET
ncbi:probable serine/threonine-protein kinase DDB_G0282963 [Copidosoma floridanum]|uniref:probable serine/threonine-protein kinase DDB_G0282963 n=1 Tax=Copidosoma floridanum TaxID=29053 RepID=UPI000C6F849B|nr:probable serine/threonine-protein kinase DDB_G0282963 [Copidosoma floridanum]